MLASTLIGQFDRVRSPTPPGPTATAAVAPGTPTRATAQGGGGFGGGKTGICWPPLTPTHQSPVGSLLSSPGALGAADDGAAVVVRQASQLAELLSNAAGSVAVYLAADTGCARHAPLGP